MIQVLANALSHVLYHGFEGTEGISGFPNTGTWLIFGVILVPVYIMIAAWFLGEPRDTNTGLLGVSYLVGITIQMWLGMLILTLLLGIVFFGEIPEPIGPVGP